MTAARTKQQEETCRDKDGEKEESKAKRHENRTQGVNSNKVSRLCYKAEPGTLSHDTRSAIFVPVSYVFSSTVESRHQ